MNTIKEAIERWSTVGIRLPFLFDPVSNKPSITLLFTYVTFLLSIISIIVLHLKPDLVVATASTLIFWVLAVVFYLLRNLQKAKFDLDDKSIELESDEGKKE